MRKDLKKRQSEIKNNIEKVQVRYGLGEISDSVYQATFHKLNKDLAEIERGLAETEKNLSNLQKFIDEAIAMSCKLGTLWEQGDFSSRQKLQNLLFPSGIYFDKNTDDYRTENENKVFKIFRLFSSSCENAKEKVTTEYLRLSPSVEVTGLEPATSWSQTRNATNCATPRRIFCGCKGTKYLEHAKGRRGKSGGALHFFNYCEANW